MATESRGPQVASVTILFTVLSWIVVLLRCYVRIRIVKRFFLDDWLTIISLALFTVYSGYGLAGVHWGAGQHVYNLPIGNIRASMKVWYFCEIFYTLTAIMVRVTAGVFIHRFSRLRAQRLMIYAGIAINVTYNIMYLAAIVYQCIPLSYFWTRFDPGSEGICFDPAVGVKFTLGNSVVAAVTDWTFGLMPIWIMWTVKLTLGKKIVVCLMMGLGALASTAPLVRLPYIAGLFDSKDFLWATTDVAIWSVVELGVGIVVISLHSLRPLFKEISFFTRLSSANSNQTPEYHTPTTQYIPRDMKMEWSVQRDISQG